MLNKKEQVLFSESFDAYQRICSFGRNHIILYRKLGESATTSDLIAQYDLQLHLMLLEISGFFEKALSKAERIFLQSIMEHSELLIEDIPDFFTYFYNMTECTFRKVSGFLLDAPIIHSALKLALRLKEDELSSAVELVMENLRTVLMSFAMMSEGETRAKREARANAVMERHQAFINSSDDASMQRTEVAVSRVALPPNESKKAVLDELDSLIGLEDVKREIKNVIRVLEINRVRVQAGLPQLTVAKHMLFLGNPGTAKTTVARIVAQIFKEYGVVSKGTFVEANRESLVASVVGGTAIKTQKLAEKAHGGILFVDEAYALVSEGYKDDFGYEAISVLLKHLEDYEDFVVIFAGYPKEMARLLQSNPGLRSRFRKSLCFHDYSSTEMLKIFRKFADNMGYHVSKEAENKLSLIFDEAHADTDFGNGRGVRNVFETVVERQAARLLKNSSIDIDKEALCAIEEGDIPHPSEFLKTRKKKTHQIGFAV